MFRRIGERYVVLQEHVPLREQQAMERSLVKVLPPVMPSQDFVTRLGHDLVEEARRQQVVQLRHTNQAFRFLGIFGGLVSVVGGVILWLLLRRDGDDPQRNVGLPGQSAASAPPSAY